METKIDTFNLEKFKEEYSIFLDAFKTDSDSKKTELLKILDDIATKSKGIISVNKKTFHPDVFKLTVQETLNKTKDAKKKSVLNELLTLNDQLKLKLEEFAKSESGYEDNINNFKLFLSKSGLSTNHASEIYKMVNAETTSFKVKRVKGESTDVDFKIRKTHPKWDFILEKLSIYLGFTTLASFGIGFGINWAVKPGTKVLWALTSTNPISTTLTLGLPIVVGLGAATFALVKGVDAGVKAGMKAKYGSGKSNLKELEDGKTIENLKVSKLMTKINETEKDLLAKREGKKFLAYPWDHIVHPIWHIRNKQNRNRVHRLEKITQDLISILDSRSNEVLDDTNKKIRLGNVYKLLESISTFMEKDIEMNKLHAMATCRETSKHHVHPYIENVDTYANLLNVIESSRKKRLSKRAVKKLRNNIAEKQQKAEELINNGPSLISRLIEKYEDLKLFKDPKSSDEEKNKDEAKKEEKGKEKETPKPIKKDPKIDRVEKDPNGNVLFIYYKNGDVKVYNPTTIINEYKVKNNILIVNGKPVTGTGINVNDEKTIAAETTMLRVLNKHYAKFMPPYTEDSIDYLKHALEFCQGLKTKIALRRSYYWRSIDKSLYQAVLGYNKFNKTDDHHFST